MNKYEKEVVQAQLNNEKAVLKKLESNYQDALDEINDRIAILLGRDDAEMQHVIYQVEYQEALKKQIQSILEKMQANEFETLAEYLSHSYEEGFIGTMYELHGQGIPLVIPINQEQIVAAIQHETKLSDDLYSELGRDIKDVSKKIAGEISRGISNGATYKEMASNIARYVNIPKNNAMRIARTEAHRIQETAAANAQEKAKEMGADIVKIWDATLDSKTRPHHIKLDGQIRELDKPFEVAGLKAMRPGQFGKPKEDINCRCRSRADARWALTADETKMLGDTSKMSQKQLEALADKLHLSVDELKGYSDQIIPVKAKSYDDFKRQYNQLWKYEGSDLQKEAEKRIGGYAKQRVRSNAQKMKDNQVAYEIDTMKERTQEKIRSCFDDLKSQYNSPLKTVKHGASGKKGTKGDTDITGEVVGLNNTAYTTMAHEFFHTLASTSRDKAGLSDDSDFWKEIKAIRKDYNEAVAKGATHRISAYADTSLDEFAAECFGQYKAITNGEKLGWEFGEDTTYSEKVVSVVDKYFKKTPLENIGKSSTIESDNKIPLDLQFFAKKTKHADQRLVERIVSDSAIDDALEHPLYKSDVVIDAKGRPSVKYIGSDATVIFNPDTEEVVTTWRTGSRTKKKYGKGD